MHRVAGMPEGAAIFGRGSVHVQPAQPPPHAGRGTASLHGAQRAGDAGGRGGGGAGGGGGGGGGGGPGGEARGGPTPAGSLAARGGGAPRPQNPPVMWRPA